MWRDYCARLKQRSSGMGALKHQEARFDSISRASPKNVFEPPQLTRMREQHVLFPASLCPPCMDGEDKDLLQTQIIWSPLFDGVELSSGMKKLGGTGTDLPVGWRTAEQKILELKNLDRSSCNGEFVNFGSSSASNSDDEPQALWASAKCLLHMNDLPDSPNDQERSRDLEDGFLLKTCDLGLSLDPNENFEKQGLCSRDIMVESHNVEIEKLTGYQSELSMEESKYQSCSAGDSSVCGGGIGRGKLSKGELVVNDFSVDTRAGDSLETRPMIMKTSTNNDSRRHSRVNKEQKVKNAREQQLQPKQNLVAESEQQARHTGDRKPARRAYVPDVRDGCRSTRAANQRWSSGSRTPVQRNARRESVQRVPKEDSVPSSKLRKQTSERHGNDGRQQQQRRDHASFSDEVVSVASPTGEEEPSTTSRSFTLQQPHNTELVSALAELNLRELRALQCSAAVMRHNIGILEDDVKSLLNCIERKRLRSSWWRLFKDFMVAAGLVTGAFGLRTVIDTMRRSTYRHGAALQRITNKQEKMALAAFLLTVGARFGKQLWSHKTSERKTRMSDQLNQIRERVALMSHLATTATVDIVRALPPPGESE